MNLTAIVDSLLDSPLQEEGDDLFLSSIDANHIDVVGAEEQTVNEASVMVKWRADHEYRSWGIKSIEPVIESVSGWLSLETIEDQARSSTIRVDGFTADATFETVERGSVFLYPLSAEINLRNRTVLIRF
jgi:hypothetical protein